VWVAENDAVGSMCARYLRDHGLDRSIDLVAFDDTTEAFIGDFSSYNFNVPAVMRAMLEHLLHPVPLRASELADYPVELEGYVVERGTVQTGSRYV
jgi:hypothetical protein